MKLKKRYGQHLLSSEGVLGKIAQALSLKEEDVVAEVGGGTGNLTRELIKKPLKRLYVLEIDEDMVSLLQTIEDPRIEIVPADASKFNFCSLGKELKVVGNLPYNVGSLIIDNVVKHHTCIRKCVFMLQKEVALKLVGKEEASWLSVFLNTFFHVKYIMSIPPKFFIPPPRVDSGLIECVSKEEVPDIDPNIYKRLLTRIFSMRRKKLKKKIPLEILERAHVNPHLRVEELSLEDFVKLYNVYEENLR